MVVGVAGPLQLATAVPAPLAAEAVELMKMAQVAMEGSALVVGVVEGSRVLTCLVAVVLVVVVVGEEAPLIQVKAPLAALAVAAVVVVKTVPQHPATVETVARALS